MAKIDVITHARLLEVLHYEPSTGLFTWLEDGRGRFKKKGRIAGAKNRGYIQIQVDGEFYNAHRLAFFYMMGRWPVPECDHYDLDKSNNRWDNLREATLSQNRYNCPPRSNNKLGMKGVCFSKIVNKYRAYITANKKTIHLGYFDTAEAAHEARIDASKELHGAFARLA